MKIDWSSITCNPSSEALEELGLSWGWLIGEPFEPLLFSALGDVFLAKESGGIWWLNTGTGELSEVADSLNDFEEMLGTDKTNDWMMPSLIQKLHEAGKIPAEGECFTYVTMPVFSQGRYEVGNLNPVPAQEHFGMTGRVIKDIQNLPDGASVRIIVGE